jgi:N12 class adenine-specific DNA methylase
MPTSPSPYARTRMLDRECAPARAGRRGCDWGTHRRAGLLLSDALNSLIRRSSTPQGGDSERRILNTVETGRRKQTRQIKSAFSPGWSVDRTDQLARLYSTFNNIVPRHFQRGSSHSRAPGALFSIWAPEAGDLADVASDHLRRPRRGRRPRRCRRGRDHGAARLGLVNRRARRTRPLLAQAAREFLALYRAPASSWRMKPIS